MADRKKADVDAEVRGAGLARIDTDGLTAIAGNTFIGSTVVDGLTRFYEIKVVAKKIGFSQDDVDAILAERAEIDERKAETAAAAAKKKQKDAEKRAKKEAEEKTE